MEQNAKLTKVEWSIPMQRAKVGGAWGENITEATADEMKEKLIFIRTIINNQQYTIYNSTNTIALLATLSLLGALQVLGHG